MIDVLIVNFLISFEYFNGKEAHSISQTPGTRSWWDAGKMTRMQD